MTNAANHTDFTSEYLDTRDLIERLDYLTDAEQDFLSGNGDALDTEENDELATLRKVADELSDYSEYEDGITLIADSYKVEWAEETARDCGYIPEGLPGWIDSNIDWDGVADDLLQCDYNEIEIDGNTFHYRSY